MRRQQLLIAIFLCWLLQQISNIATPALVNITTTLSHCCSGSREKDRLRERDTKIGSQKEKSVLKHHAAYQ